MQLILDYKEMLKQVKVSKKFMDKYLESKLKRKSGDLDIADQVYQSWRAEQIIEEVSDEDGTDPERQS